MRTWCPNRQTMRPHFERKMGVSYGPKDPYETYATSGLNLPYYIKTTPVCLVSVWWKFVEFANDVE